jgi:hypothetical protein
MIGKAGSGEKGGGFSIVDEDYEASVNYSDLSDLNVVKL